MPTQARDVSQLLCQFIDDSQDGYALYDKNDKLVYCNNPFMEVFCLKHSDLENIYFEGVIRHAFARRRGINIETDNLDNWLLYVRTVRRSRTFRSFEVDLVDGRWFLFSEQINPNGDMLVQAKDITKQKMLESELKSSVTTLNQLALTDELTQIANRRSFVESVESELTRCEREKSCVTLMLIDLDHFKQINDTQGHQAGDMALKHIANLLRQVLRQYDIVGRIGGEEFAVFLGSAPPNLAHQIAERIRIEIAARPVNLGDAFVHLTTSIGMASRKCGCTFEQLFNDADDALYKAKAEGRNRVHRFNYCDDANSPTLS